MNDDNKGVYSQEINFPLHIFHQGKNANSYEILGLHKTETGMVFRTWAPRAKSVSIVGDFCDWDENAHKLHKITDGIWEIFLGFQMEDFQTYKVAITDNEGRVIQKADPYGFHFETRPGTASKFYNIKDFKWTDKKWYDKKKKRNHSESPVNIYEVHAGSWKKYADGSVFSYEKL